MSGNENVITYIPETQKSKVKQSRTKSQKVVSTDNANSGRVKSSKRATSFEVQKQKSNDTREAEDPPVVHNGKELSTVLIANGNSLRTQGSRSKFEADDAEPLIIRGPSAHNSFAARLLRKKIRKYTVKELRLLIQEAANLDEAAAKALFRVVDAVERQKKIKYGASSRACGEEIDNLDSIAMIRSFNDDPRNVLCCITQGHGNHGHSIGKRVVNQLPLIFENDGFNEGLTDVESLIRNAFLKMEGLLYNTMEAYISGATASLVVVKGKDLYIGNVGMLDVVLAERQPDKSVKARIVTESHRPDKPEEKERIEKSGGKVGQWHLANVENVGEVCVWKLGEARSFDERSNDEVGVSVSRSLGDFRAKEFGVIPEPFVQKIELNANHLFCIVGSRGLWGAINAQEAVDLASNYTDAQKAAEALTHMAEDRWESQFRAENASAFLIRLSDVAVDMENANKVVAEKHAAVELMNSPSIMTLGRRGSVQKALDFMKSIFPQSDVKIAPSQ
eukprot:g944.t1